MNTPICRDLSLLHPAVYKQFVKLSVDLAVAHAKGEIEQLFKPFETWRHPDRQSKLLIAKTTKAGPWKSSHQYGLAVDFVPCDFHHSWHWEDLPGEPPIEWNKMHQLAYRNGLTVPISWDKPHVESRIWAQIKPYLK